MEAHNGVFGGVHENYGEVASPHHKTRTLGSTCEGNRLQKIARTRNLKQMLSFEYLKGFKSIIQ